MPIPYRNPFRRYIARLVDEALNERERFRAQNVNELGKQLRAAVRREIAIQRRRGGLLEIDSTESRFASSRNPDPATRQDADEPIPENDRDRIPPAS